MASNGLTNNMMIPVCRITYITKEYREQWHSPWEFPEWIPSMKDWMILPQSEIGKYLPQEVKSAPFQIRREGAREDDTLYRIGRFQSLPPHPDRWDLTFFVGGPVWSLEWCPTPEGSSACHYAAVYCSRGMDDRHKIAEAFTEPGLLQIWRLGNLQNEICPEEKPSLAYGITVDQGCIWDMKFCPSGAWELPRTKRKLPQMARLGLLAVAFSSGRIAVYSLPHPESLNAHRRSQLKGSPGQSDHTICKVQCTAVLEVGSVHAGISLECGQCFCLAWEPTKTHQRLVAGFYDGTVAVWSLVTKSLLLRVRQAGSAMKLYPFHCFTAHDHAVRTIAWCKANSNFLATAGYDRKVKFWDLRRWYEPLNIFKRSLHTELTWVLPWCGVLTGQETCFSAYGLNGIHYVDSGYLGFRPYFLVPRGGTVWSISSSDWLNTCVSGDAAGEVIAVVLPNLMENPVNLKRSSERRFPIYKIDLVQYPPVSASTSPASGERSEAGQEESEAPAAGANCKPTMYNEMLNKYYLLFEDTNLKTFKNFKSRKLIRRLHTMDTKSYILPDRMPLDSIYRTRFSPNLDNSGWILSAGHSGIVRAHCIRALNNQVSRKLVKESQAQFNAMYLPEEEEEEAAMGTGDDSSYLNTSHSVDTSVQTE
ncbi:general transcription factor 3C polypeptide 2 [Latimeria chalumnae]|uniref:general transcription factor 3C polypeptide 2 n=1 Tax=Latimeria chalumnae TaxID=7897 RepID=UPI00313D0F18